MEKFFERIVCLNVDKRFHEQKRLRDDVLENLGQELEFFVVGEGKLLPPEKYNRIDVPLPPTRRHRRKWMRLPHSYNAYLSFKAILEQAKKDNCANILILEDDIEFVPDFKSLFQKSWEQLQENYHNGWDLFYLGANHRRAWTMEISPNLLRVRNSNTFHAIAIANRLFQTIIDLPLSKSIDIAVASHVQCYKQNITLACWPSLVLQKDCISCCEECYSNKSWYWPLRGKQRNNFEALYEP